MKSPAATIAEHHRVHARSDPAPRADDERAGDPADAHHRQDHAEHLGAAGAGQHIGRQQHEHRAGEEVDRPRCSRRSRAAPAARPGSGSRRRPGARPPCASQDPRRSRPAWGCGRSRARRGRRRRSRCRWRSSLRRRPGRRACRRAAGAMTPAAGPVICPIALARSRWLSGTSIAIEAWNAGRSSAANSRCAERERIEMPELERAGGEAQQQQAAAEDEADVGDQHHAATIEPVGERAGEPAQQDRGHGREEGDERERRGVPGGAEHGDADRVFADLAADQRHRLGDEQRVVDGEPRRRRQARNLEPRALWRARGLAADAYRIWS